MILIGSIALGRTGGGKEGAPQRTPEYLPQRRLAEQYASSGMNAMGAAIATASKEPHDNAANAVFIETFAILSSAVLLGFAEVEETKSGNRVRIKPNLPPDQFQTLKEQAASTLEFLQASQLRRRATLNTP